MDKNIDIDIKKLIEDALEEEKLLAALSYVGPAFLFVKWRGDESEFDRYHAGQGCLLFAARLVTKLIRKLPLLGKPTERVIRLALNALAVVGMKNAICGDMKPLPYIGKLRVNDRK